MYLRFLIFKKVFILNKTNKIFRNFYNDEPWICREIESARKSKVTIQTDGYG